MKICQPFGHLRRPTFIRRRGTSCMLPCSGAGVVSAQFPLSPESGPGGSRNDPDAFRAILGAPPEFSGGGPKVLLGLFSLL